jgi:hypothetical protein
MIYIVIEPDRGGEVIRKWLAESSIRPRVKLVTLMSKDPSAVHLKNPGEFSRHWQIACEKALPWRAVEAETRTLERTSAWEKCSQIAGQADILEEFPNTLSSMGVVGERRAAKIVYLAITSRLLDRPISVAIKGPSSGGNMLTYCDDKATSAPTKVPRSATPSKPQAQSFATSRHTPQTSIRSNRPSQSSRRICANTPSAPCKTYGCASARFSACSPTPNAKTSFVMPDMRNSNREPL